MEEITLYLNQQDPGFAQGFKLFCKYSRNQSLMSYIGRKREMEQLLYELEKLSSMGRLTVNPNHEAQHIRFNREDITPLEASTNSKQEEDNHFFIVDERKVRREDLPEELQKLYDEITEQYKVQRSMHEKMKLANSDTGRKEFRDEVVNLQQSIAGKWRIIDEQLQNGEPTPKEVPAKRVHVSSHRAYISKMLAKQKLSNEQKETVRRKVEELLNIGEILKPETLKKLKEKGL